MIDESGEHIGVVETKKALKKAKEKGLDLVEVAPDQRPSVAKILDYGKFRYQQKKKKKKGKKKSHAGEIKGVRFSFRTSDHDLKIKADRADKFLDKDYKVKVEMLLRGREKGRKEMIDEKIERFLSMLKHEVVMDQEPKPHPRGLNFIIRKD